jgi:hypothetical protein
MGVWKGTDENEGEDFYSLCTHTFPRCPDGSSLSSGNTTPSKRTGGVPISSQGFRIVI